MKKGLLLLAVAVALGGCEVEDTQTGKPEAAKPTAESLVDGAGDEKQFCRRLAVVLESGLGEDAAFGAFLRGYGGGRSIPAREVFDEYVSRC